MVSDGRYQDALKNYDTAMVIRREINDSKGIATCLTNIAAVNFGLGNYPLALKKNLEALKIEIADDDKVAIARSYNNIGNIYLQQKNYDQALKSYNKALAIQKTIGDKQGMGRCYNNMGAVLFKKGDFNNALPVFAQAYEIKKAIGDKYGIGRSLINMGNMYWLLSLKINDPEQKTILLEKSLDKLKQSMEVLKEINDKQGVAMNHNNLGSVYVMLHQPGQAKEELEAGLKMAKELGSKDDIKDGYAGWYALDSATGNWEKAFEDHKLYMLYRDSLLNDENTQQTVQAQMNFDFEQKELKTKAEQEKKDAVFEEQIKNQKSVTWFSIILAGMILITVVLLFNRARLKQKQQYQERLMQQQKEQAIAVMETQENERKRIAEDLHDSLGHLLSTVKLNLQTLPDDQRHYYVNALQLINQASTEIRNISFDLMPQTLEEEGLVPALHELAEKIRKSSLYDILLQVHDMEDFELDKQTKFNIYRIVQEAVNNIMKHADAKEINIQLIKQEDQLMIMIEDDGKGFNTAEMKRSGRGLQNITARSQWLHGTIQIDSTPGRGTTISIEIPLNNKA
jgi:signal transduction histidine kinase/Tfp pilus assembly protein PilF